jgi:hypothetical protein
MSDKHPGFVPVDEYLKLPRDPATWLIKSLIPLSGAALLYGQEKSGKSAIAIQLAAALSGGASQWMGFAVGRTGPVLYLQLDTPRSTWAKRFEILRGNGLEYTSNLFLADRETVEHFPFDILLPEHMNYLKLLCAMRQPIAVFVDTLRESHSGDENESTTARNVIANIVGAIGNAALIIVSHSRKPQPDTDKDLMADHRGSSYITGRMDAILRMTSNRLYYGGRSIEQGSIKLNKLTFEGLTADDGGVVMFEPAVDEATPLMSELLMNPKLPTLRDKARELAKQVGTSEEAAMSRIRRYRDRLVLEKQRPPQVVASSTLPPVVEVVTPLHLGA